MWKETKLPAAVVDAIQEFRDDNASGSLTLNFHCGRIETLKVLTHRRLNAAADLREEQVRGYTSA